MSRPPKHASLFREIPRAPQTAQDRTAANAQQIVAQQAEKRADLTLSLRAARLARDAVGAPVEPEPEPEATAPKAAPKVLAKAPAKG